MKDQVEHEPDASLSLVRVCMGAPSTQQSHIPLDNHKEQANSYTMGIPNTVYNHNPDSNSISISNPNTGIGDSNDGDMDMVRYTCVSMGNPHTVCVGCVCYV